MILTSLFRREHLLVMIAAMTGMFAQEIVSRITSAEDRAPALAAGSEQLWHSSEAFYVGDRRARALFAVGGEPPAADRLVAALSLTRVAIQDEPSRVRRTWPVEQGVGGADPRPPVAVQPPESHGELAAESAPAEQTPLETLPLPAPRTPAGDESELVGPLPPSGPTGRSIEDPAHHYPLEGTASARMTPSERPPYIDRDQRVRERAMERGDQRRQRLEAYRQMGYSPLRPTVPVNAYFSGEPPHPVVVVLPIIVVQTHAYRSDNR